MPDSDILRVLRHFNAHWESGEVSDLIRRSPHRRRSFAHLRDRIRDLPFEVVAGPRQVGKTTLVGHLMADLLDQGVESERVVYVAADNPTLSLEMGGRLAPVVDAYERYVLKESLPRTREKVFFFIDEIHSLPDWGAELKALYDLYNPTLRVLATGSSSAALLNPPTADLPGRVERSHIHPLKFGEAVQNLLPQTEMLHARARATRDILARCGRERSGEVAASLQMAYDEATKYEREIQRMMDAYLVRGGYPAALAAKTGDEAFRFFENTVDTVMSMDLKLYEKVRKPGAFKVFLAKLARDHGGKFVSASYAKDLGLDKETPATWKTIVEELFIAHQLPQLNDSLSAIPGKADKAYIQDAGMRAFLSNSMDIEVLDTSGAIGTVVEAVLFDHLRRLQFNTLGHRQGRIGYWAKPEVDFIVELPRTWLAIECKYRASSRPGTNRLEALFADDHRVIPLVATRDRFDTAGPVWNVPVWLLLLLA